MKVKLTDLIGPAFYDLHHSVLDGEFTHYWLKGGRGSLKSSFVSIEIVSGIMRDAAEEKMTHAVVYRKVGQTLSTSVIPQIAWAIHSLGVSHLWDIPKRNREFTFIPTGQTIRFEGTDDPVKQKGTKVSKGYFKYIWYEEVDQFNGIEEIRTVNQSIIRGSSEDVVVFYTYNPPQSSMNWVNKEVLVPQDNKVVHHSTYLEAPEDWLGELFIIEAETLRETNPTKYLHEYMGAVTGTGGEVFRNLDLREITDEEINTFDNNKYSVDFGFSIDPLAFVVSHFDSKRHILYIYDEIYGTDISNRNFAKMLYDEGYASERIISDVEPRTVNELRKHYGIRIDQAKKGPGSREAGFKFLKDLNKIVIDPVRCPNVAREFREYEYERNRAGEWIEGYPNKNDHAIDSVRYGLESEMRRNFEWG